MKNSLLKNKRTKIFLDFFSRVSISAIFISAIPGKINDFEMKSPITNFYKTCSISRASETMSLCNEKLNSKIAAE